MRQLKRIILAAGLGWACLTAAAQQQVVRQFVNSNGLSAAGIGIMVKEVETGKVVAQYQPETNRIPASTTKLLTTATALEVLGDSMRFETRITYSGYIKDSVLHGNLYVVGGGDPSLESDFFVHNGIFAKMVSAIHRAGIRQIDGKIIGDASLYTVRNVPTQWLIEDVGSYYGQTPSALAFNDNLFFLTFAPTDSIRPPHLEAILPHTRLLRIDNQLTLGNPMWWHVYGDSHSWYKIIRGEVPATRKTLIRVENPEPALLVADSLSRELYRHGIHNRGAGSTQWTKVRAPKSPCIYVHYSLPLRDIIAVTNHKSVNLFAENIFLYLALRINATGDYEHAINSVTRFWNGKGLNCSHIHQVDGSGLSMKNALNPDFMTNLLVYMKRDSKYADAFTASLATAGVNGTVKTFLTGTPLQGKMLAKSGSMDRVQNFCGYIIYKQKWYAFTIMVNNFDCSRKDLRKAMSTFFNNLMKQVGN